MLLNISKIKRILKSCSPTELKDFTGLGLRTIWRLKSDNAYIETAFIGSLLKIQNYDDSQALVNDEIVDLGEIERLFLDETPHAISKLSGLNVGTVTNIKNKGLQVTKLSTARKLLSLNHVTIDLMKLERLVQDTPLQELAAKCDLTDKELHTLERSDLDGLTIGTAKKLINLL